MVRYQSMIITASGIFNEGPPTCIFSMIRVLTDEITLALLILSLTETPVVIRSMSIVPVPNNNDANHKSICELEERDH